MVPPRISPSRGRHFAFGLPEGWSVADEGPFAVVLVPPDQRAIALCVGNAGLPAGADPGGFAYGHLAQSGLGALRFGPPRPAPPAMGFPYAWEFDADYVVGGMACRGLARVSVAPAYDSQTCVLTWAASVVETWPFHAAWLPGLAGGIVPLHGGVFGAHGIMQQNLANAAALGAQAAAHREWSAQTWGQVAAERDASAQRIAGGRGEALSGTERYHNPVTGQPIDLPVAHASYWVHPDTGRIVGHDDPTFDPRTPGDPRWERLRKG